MLAYMTKLENYITGNWITGDGEGQLLYNAVTGAPVAAASTKGLDFKSIIEYGRTTGNPALRKMTFHQRGNMLKALALHLRNHLEKFYTISYQTGATKADSWVDIEGGIGNLFANASLRRKFPDEVFCIDGESHNLSKNNTFMGTHILVRKEGVAIHINAFNFPVGECWKNCSEPAGWCACHCKTGHRYFLLTEAFVKEIIASKILPRRITTNVVVPESFSHVTSQDIITFTGSASTGSMLKKTTILTTMFLSIWKQMSQLYCAGCGCNSR
jgi:oxepin-CoA hydrolase/3-oxo-5,6-dehydrosuberyl-CoA semialdehyde dehydrogenase